MCDEAVATAYIQHSRVARHYSRDLQRHVIGSSNLPAPPLAPPSTLNAMKQFSHGISDGESSAWGQTPGGVRSDLFQDFEGSQEHRYLYWASAMPKGCLVPRRPFSEGNNDWWELREVMTTIARNESPTGDGSKAGRQRP